MKLPTALRGTVERVDPRAGPRRRSSRRAASCASGRPPPCRCRSRRTHDRQHHHRRGQPGEDREQAPTPTRADRPRCGTRLLRSAYCGDRHLQQRARRARRRATSVRTPCRSRPNSSRISGSRMPNAVRSSSSTALSPNSTNSGNTGPPAAERSQPSTDHRSAARTGASARSGSSAGWRPWSLPCSGRSRPPNIDGAATMWRAGDPAQPARRAASRAGSPARPGGSSSARQNAGPRRQRLEVGRQEPLGASQVQRAEQRAGHRGDAADHHHREHRQVLTGIVRTARRTPAGDARTGNRRRRRSRREMAKAVSFARTALMPNDCAAEIVLPDGDEHPAGAAAADAADRHASRAPDRRGTPRRWRSASRC